MAFYFRKLGRSVRLVPTAKSLGYSTRISEGDKKDDGTYCRKQKHAQIIGSQGDPTHSSSSSSSLLSPVPLSVRDVSLMLLPRLDVAVKGNSRHPSDKLHPFMSVAKIVPFTNDDIFPEFLNLPCVENSLIMERIVFNLRPTDYNYNRNDKLLQCDEVYCQAFESSETQVNMMSKCKEHELKTDSIFKTLYMSDGGSQFSCDHGFSCSSIEDKTEKSSKKSKGGPSSEQLHSMKEKLENLVDMMFTTRYDYSLLHNDVVLENNLFGENIIRRGQTLYAFELLKLRFKIHSRFSSSTMEVLNTTVNEDTGVIRIHWRLKGLPQTEILKFWRLFQARERVSSDDWQWFEAFSYFHIGKDGLVHKHRIDRMLPGSDQPEKLSLKLRKLLNPAKPLVT